MERSTQLLEELKQFAGFSASEQRYIRRSLDVGLDRPDAAEFWARNAAESAAIEAQAQRYRACDLVRHCIWDEDKTKAAESLLAPLIAMSHGDLADGKLESFESYSFLYERLVGGQILPWLLSAFCAAASSPALPPARRRQLMESIPLQAVTAGGWVIRDPCFYPQWVEKVPAAVA